MENWEVYLQTIVIGLIFAFLLSKLISLLTSFSHQNLRLTRTPEPEFEPESSSPKPPGSSDSAGSLEAEMGTERDVNETDEDDDDDDWEGVESTELDEAFSAATSFVAATATDKKKGSGVTQEKQLELYGLYKIATEGPCTAPQPSALKMTARAKWQAWQKLGAMPPEEAMTKYIDIVTELFPSWLSGSSMKSRGDNASSSDRKGQMGPVFSSFVHEEESGTELKMDAVHAFAREGEVENLRKAIESGAPVNIKDSEGRTPLHWAVDRGHLDVVELLVGKNADINAKDNDGETPLHYAVICERADVAEYLVKHNADAAAKDNDGSSAGDICELNWPWMKRETKQTS